MDTQATRQAIIDAEQELQVIRVELQRVADLQKRRASLENFLKHARALLEVQPDPIAAEAESAARILNALATPPPDAPLWAHIVTVLNGVYRPMTAPEAWCRGRTASKSSVAQ
jgi:hypothetical protein